MYLALTGSRLKAADLVYSQIATHFVPSDLLPELTERLEQLEAPPEQMAQSIEMALEEVASVPPGESLLQQNRANIDTHFGGESVEAILAGLEADGGEWAAKHAGLLRKMSPTSLKITHRQVSHGG